MSYPKHYDLNMGERLLTHLEIPDALKEIISNGIDEHVLTNTNKDIEIYQNSNKKWCIKDFGRGLKQQHFKFNINEDKELNHDIIGMYGFGLKDAFGILHSRNIKFKIYTKLYIYTPILRPKADFPDELTLHIEVIKNTTYEIKKGTEFVFDNLTLDDVTKAKNKFIKFMKPRILLETSDYKLFKQDSYQSIFINGVEVYNDSGFHFSYDIKSNDKINRCFNRDRKELDLEKLKPYITKFLSKVIIPFTNQNELFLEILKDILKSNSGEFMQEFGRISILRNIITQLNDLNLYVFVGTKEKLTKIIKDKITQESKEIITLGDGVKSKFNVSHIKDLYHKEKFYSQPQQETSNNINTLLNYIPPPTIINSTEYIQEVLKPIEKIFTIPENLKIKVLNSEFIQVDDYDADNDSEEENESDSEDDTASETTQISSLQKYGYDLDGDILKFSKSYTDPRNKKKLFVLLFRYIANNIDDEKIEELIGNKKTGWFW
jgi:hypothetical protein